MKFTLDVTLAGADRHHARRGHRLAVRAGGARVRRGRVGVRRQRLRDHHPRARTPTGTRSSARSRTRPRSTSKRAPARPADDEVAEARKLLRNAVAPPKPRPVEIGRRPSDPDEHLDDPPSGRSGRRRCPRRPGGTRAPASIGTGSDAVGLRSPTRSGATDRAGPTRRAPASDAWAWDFADLIAALDR